MYSNYDSSSYYRSNPYKELNYLPPGAHKNRKEHEFYAEIPQGQEFFLPTTKKHYNNAYNSQIEHDKLMADSGVRSPLQKQAAQRSYFRSLNSKDIEGANTNTLISKAVKNKMIAQKELDRRRREQEEKKVQEQRIRKQLDQYHNRNVVANAYNNGSNFHEQQKQQQRMNSQNNNSEVSEKKRRENELLKLAQQRKNYAIVSLQEMQKRENFHHQNNLKNSNAEIDSYKNPQREEPPRNEQRQFQYEEQGNTVNIEPLTHKPQQEGLNKSNVRNYHEDHQKDYEYMQMMRQKQLYEQQQTQSQQKYGRRDDNYQERNLKSREAFKEEPQPKRNFFEEKPRNMEEQYYQQSPNQNMERAYQQRPQQQHQQHPSYNQYSASELKKNKDRELFQQMERERQQYGRGYGNMPSNQYSYAPQSPDIPNPKKSYAVNNTDYPQQAGQNNETPARNTFSTRQQLRRHNPTFLSYGSPSFSVAYRNIMNY